MKNLNTVSENINLIDDENLLKAIALKEYEGESYFITDDGKVYEGDESAVKESYEPAKEDYDSFNEFCESECTEIEPYNEDDYNQRYMVLTDDEADEKCAESIKDSLWAFNASFIIEHSKLPYDAQDMIKSYQSDKCEGANDTIEALIDDIDEFIEDAILADGRGHFLNTYDGNENEQELNGITYFIYRMN